MNNKNNRFTRILSLLILAALLLSALPAAALADSSFSAAVKSRTMKVYADASGKNYLGSLKQKTVVTVKQHANGVAKISYNGMTGYAKTSDLVSVESFAETAKTARKSRVYANEDGTGASRKIKSGVKLHVLAVKNGVAMVEKSGAVGYMNADHLKFAADSAFAQQLSGTASSGTASGSDIIAALPDQVVDVLPDSVVEELEKNEYTSDQLEDLKDALEEEYKKQQGEKKEESKKEESSSVSFADAYKSGKYSNEQLCYLFATQVMGYNRAAAAGLLANINAESGFRVNANGDSGQSYGICQWYSSRKSRLLNWCQSNGLDPATLGGQLYFLKYELETYYPSVHKYMKNVANSEQGAYDAGYYFCYHFEAPASKASKSVSRGNKARSTYFPKYA